MSKMKFKKIIEEKIEKDGKVKLKVQKDGFHSVLVRLNPNEKLSNIRQELEKNSVISMKDIHLFAAKSNVIAREQEKDWKLDDIIETSGNDKILCLVKNSTPNVRFLIDHCKLEYGRTITPSGIEVASEKSFDIEGGYKLEEFGAEGCGKGKYEYNSNESEMIKTLLSLSSDIDVQNFANFGLSFGKTKSTNSKSEISSTCNFTFYNKVSLKLFEEDLEKINYHHLKPTEKFRNKIEMAIKSANPRKEFKEITKEFGRFISNEVLLGGKIYFEGEESLQETLKENEKEFGMNLSSPASKTEAKKNAVNSIGKFKRSKNELFKLIGSKQPNSLEEFDEKTWIESLNDFESWGCTEYKKPVSIFRPLPYDLRKRIFKSIGKRILYNDPGEDYIYLPEKKSFELKNVPPHIADIIQKEDAECNIFATVIDTDDSKNDFFNCQILWIPNKKPRLIIHCIQNSNFKKPKYNLKIGLMVVGYDINFDFVNSDSNIHFEVIENKIEASKSMYCKKIFKDSFTKEYKEYEEHICIGIPVLRELKPSLDSLVIGHHFFNYQESNSFGTYTFSYCLKKNHYVELPGFTFHTLIISNYPDCNEYKIIPFNCRNSIIDKILSFNFRNSVPLPNDDDTHSSQPVIPKYISLHSSEDNCAPIFLKQKQNEIKIKYMKGKENCKDNCICKKTLKEDDLKLHSLITPKALHEST
ncbi:unnamed protein product [Rhizophagus irregularis]|uniref:DUF7431 domain-containing protein n=2 Tax=Rhizophagus irregularis TaxID=588596 RepID=A0A916E5V5_9GLOM|nr:hypothetical protein RirG_089880 [Rhizophagus irregularis DAOM 197198w]CAB5209023.1 unnamed protein product [Rhizophagus irregularis]CAB5361445.1 unnamed protein product [Rhizophagus irregularis]